MKSTPLIKSRRSQITSEWFIQVNFSLVLPNFSNPNVWNLEVKKYLADFLSLVLKLYCSDMYDVIVI